MGSLTVRVRPRSSVARVDLGADGSPLVRVKAPPEGGRATREAAAVLAEALGVPRSAVTLRRGAKVPTKVFDVAGLSAEELMGRLKAR